jgi:hypothetical protein
MNLALLPIYYFSWHYTVAFSDLWRFFSNIIWFLWNFFSISLLSKTLFSPWKRMVNDEEGGNKIWKVFANAVINFLMRFVGFFMRAFTIGLGLVCVISVSIFAIIFTLIWIILPFLTLALLFAGIQILI